MVHPYGGWNLSMNGETGKEVDSEPGAEVMSEWEELPRSSVNYSHENRWWLMEFHSVHFKELWRRVSRWYGSSMRMSRKPTPMPRKERQNRSFLRAHCAGRQNCQQSDEKNHQLGWQGEGTVQRWDDRGLFWRHDNSIGKRLVWNSRKVEVLHCIRELQIMVRIKVWVKM